MGVTIHYRGRLKPKETPRNLYILAKLLCDGKKWPISQFIEGEDTLTFRKHPAQREYRGMVHSFIIKPHEHCEPLAFHITRDGYFEDRCKTQFAPPEVHLGVVDLLDNIKRRLGELVVEDEGHYWETRSQERLEKQVMACYEEILRTKEEDPAYYGPVKEPDGRITDLARG